MTSRMFIVLFISCMFIASCQASQEKDVFFVYGSVVEVYENDSGKCPITYFGVQSKFKIDKSSSDVPKEIMIFYCDHYSDNPFKQLDDDALEWKQAKYLLAIEKVDSEYYVHALDRTESSESGIGYVCFSDSMQEKIKGHYDVSYRRIEKKYINIENEYQAQFYEDSPCWEVEGSYAVAKGIYLSDLVNALALKSITGMER